MTDDLRLSRRFWPIDAIKTYALAPCSGSTGPITFQTEIRMGATYVYGEGETIAESELAAKKVFEEVVRTLAREVERRDEQKEEE